MLLLTDAGPPFTSASAGVYEQTAGEGTPFCTEKVRSPFARSKRNTLSIFLLNFFLGRTLVGWVVALVWAMKVDDFPAAVR